MSQVRILVVDDQPLFRRGLVAVLEAGGLTVVGAASGVSEAAELASRTQPDLVVADLRLADGSGIDLVRRLAEMDEAALSRSMAAYLIDDVRESQRRMLLASKLPHRERLTPRQLEILQHIAAGETTVEIADRLFLSPETVRWHVKAILRKLKARTRAEAAAVLREVMA